jgi:large subunit ribosomal protein L13
MGAAFRGPAPLDRAAAQMKTYVATPANRQRAWYLIDAEGKTLGRLATQIADALRGKSASRSTRRIATPGTS